ncbi:hypothetical protein [Clostridium chrysemydis]|uniref:hypothetical protein n=1 Tax=Clostridium chrysemydis TaxID=2665504 RepID=UPI0018834F8F|nr:hypothetical protein [Clostridium chrysemydis]
MRIKEFNGVENMYLVRVDESESWYYSVLSKCSEAYEVKEFKNDYQGTRLILIEYPKGKILEPIKQEKNVLLERPVYDILSKSFGIIKYDFNKEVIELIVFNPELESTEVLTEIPFSDLGDMINVRLITSPFALVKHDLLGDAIDFIWPKKMHIQLENNETVEFKGDGKLFASKWIEDPDYREEIIIRDIETFEIIERSKGYFRRMPDGSLWKMTL